MKIRKIYLAGPLFTLADRAHNLNLETHFIALGYEVILPQRRAKYFIEPEGLNLQAMAKDCARHAQSRQSVLVANIDGPEADSGTAVEYGLVMGSIGCAVVYRTDLRTHIPTEAGLNAMLNLPGTRLVHMPCVVDTLEDLENFYRELALEIHHAIMSI